MEVNSFNLKIVYRDYLAAKSVSWNQSVSMVEWFEIRFVQEKSVLSFLLFNAYCQNIFPEIICFAKRKTARETNNLNDLLTLLKQLNTV